MKLWKKTAGFGVLILFLWIGFISVLSAQDSSNSSWNPIRAIMSPGGEIQEYEYVYQNIPVRGFSRKILISGNKKFVIESQDIPEFSAASEFIFDSIPSKKTWYAYAQKNRLDTAICFQKKVWYPIDKKLFPAWLLHSCPSGLYGNREIVLDASEGQILNLESRLSFSGQDTIVKALVFRPDPLTKAGVQYVAPYTDQNDSDVPELNAQRDTVFIKLTLIGDTFYLKGQYVELLNIESPDDLPVRQDFPEFYFTRSQQGFEDVNIYYHLNKYQEYIQSLGFTNLCNFPLWVDPHGLNGADNSYFSPGAVPQEGYLSFGEGGVDDGEDADVIVHEYGHALSDAAAPGSNLGTERRGLDEGICDYFAAGMSYDASQFRWEELYTWDGYNEYWAGRNAHQNLIYPISGSNIYTIGSLWSSVMMDIRLDLGSLVVDRLQLQAMYLNIQNNNLKQAARNVLIADTALYNGIYSSVLVNHFCLRYLITGDECAGVSTDDFSNTDSVLMYPNPAHSKVYFNKEPGNWFLYSLDGRLLQSGSETEIDISKYPAGLFILQVSGRKYKLMVE